MTKKYSNFWILFIIVYFSIFVFFNVASADQEYGAILFPENDSGIIAVVLLTDDDDFLKNDDDIAALGIAKGMDREVEYVTEIHKDFCEDEGVYIGDWLVNSRGTGKLSATVDGTGIVLQEFESVSIFSGTVLQACGFLWP